MADNTWRRGWQAIRLRILERDRWTCQVCGTPANTVDHIILRSSGGPSEDWNLRALCASCNSRRPRKKPKPQLPRARMSRWG
jgi:5-methylcytosine-specific restriction protein A